MSRSTLQYILVGLVTGAVASLPISIAARAFMGVDPFAAEGFFVAGFFGGIWGIAIGLIIARRGVFLHRMVEKRTSEMVDVNARLREEIEERKKTEEQLRQSQKMEAIGRLARGVAHDINNVLATIMTVASTMEMELEEDSEQLGDIKDILEACKRGRDMTISLLGFARKGDFTKRPLSLSGVVAGVEKLLERVAPKTIEIVSDFESDNLQVEGDPSQFKNLLMNLCLNAIDAMNGVGRLEIIGEMEILKESKGGLPSGRYVSLKVKDTGEGMSDETIECAFDPFYTTKPEGKGTGLGLSRVWGIVREHGGMVFIDSRLGEGTTMNVLVPALDVVHHDPGIKSSVPPDPAVGSALILLVEDEAMLRKAGARLLRNLGYEVSVAADGVEAVEVFNREQNKISLVMLDMIMPRMGGEEAFLKIRETKPDVPVLVCTGYSKEDGAGRLVRENKVGFIQKPFSPGALSTELNALLQDGL